MSHYWIEIVSAASFIRCWSGVSGLKFNDVTVTSMEHHTHVAGLTVFVFKNQETIDSLYCCKKRTLEQTIKPIERGVWYFTEQETGEQSSKLIVLNKLSGKGRSSCVCRVETLWGRKRSGDYYCKVTAREYDNEDGHRVYLGLYISTDIKCMAICSSAYVCALRQRHPHTVRYELKCVHLSVATRQAGTSGNSGSYGQQKKRDRLGFEGSDKARRQEGKDCV